MRTREGAGAGSCRLLGLVLLAACADDIPPRVYLPAADYRQSLAIRTVPEPGVPHRVGTVITLYAERRTGPWRLAPRQAADLSDCWWRRPPEAHEPEVAANVAWKVTPSEGVRFNLPTAPDWKRSFQVEHPGTYRLWAVSAGCGGPFASDTLVLEFVR